MPDDLEKVAHEVLGCTQCPLHESRTIAVPGEGPVEAKVMFVGEGPGAWEDKAGKPFVGPAGLLLNQLLSSIGLDRASVFITNIVKCRPPNNRPPRKGEIMACNPYLQRQIKLLHPKVIVPLGSPAIKTVMGPDYPVGKVHGRVFRSLKGTFILPCYHPAAALHQDNTAVREILFEDFQVLRGLLDGSRDETSATLMEKTAMEIE